MDGYFSTATCCSNGSGSDITGSAIANYVPTARLVEGANIYVWAGAYYNGSSWLFSGDTYLGLSAIKSINVNSNWGAPTSTKAVTVWQAYQMDKKIDDGLPETGNVLAIYVSGQHGLWSNGLDSNFTLQSPVTNADSQSSTSCFDNGGSASVAPTYSITADSGREINCGLSFRIKR